MITSFASLFRVFPQLFRSKRSIVSEIASVRKENEILLRRLGKKKVAFAFYDKLFLVVLNRAADNFQPIHQPRTQANMRGATMVASLSTTNRGVFTPSFPQVIFSLGTAPL